MKTYSAKKSEIKRNWYLIDAKGTPMGRAATQAAILMRGKRKRDFTPNQDMGDFVVIINAKHVKLTGKKLEQKQYWHHSNYPGGLKNETIKNLLKTKPTEPLRRAIYGMIPANRLKSGQIKRLKIFADDHQNITQKLTKIEI